MVNLSNVSPTAASQGPVRRRLLLPAEHGSWAWLLFPFLGGAIVGSEFNAASLLVLMGSLAAFLARQPAAIWLRASRGKARAATGRVAARWTLALAITALATLFGLVWLGHANVLWLALPLSPILLLYVLNVVRPQATVRVLWLELAGAAALSATAPAAYAVASGRLDLTAWMLWGLFALQNVLGVTYVRQRIADTHGRASQRTPVLLVHLIATGVVAGSILGDVVPPLAVLPFAALLIRAVWVARRPRNIPNIKRFGFSEVGAELVGGLLIAASYIVS